MEQLRVGSSSSRPRTTATLARICPLPIALERIRTSALLSFPTTGGSITKIKEVGYDAWVCQPYNAHWWSSSLNSLGGDLDCGVFESPGDPEVISGDLTQREPPAEPVLISDFFDFLRTSHGPRSGPIQGGESVTIGEYLYS